MSYLNVNNVKHLQIAKDLARTAGASIDPTSASYLAAGEIVVATPGGTVLDTTTVLAADEIVLYQGRGAGKIANISPVITKKGLKKYLSKAYEAQQEEIWTIGFDGAAGAIDVINDNLYLLNVDMRESSVFGFGQQKHKYGVYKSDASATEEEISNGLLDSLIANFSREPEKDILFEELSSAASAAIAATANLVQGSDSVVYSAAHGLALGDYIRVGAATTSAVYKVKAVVSVTEVLLAVVYQGASAPAAATERITAANAQAGDFGIRATGSPRAFQTGVFNYSKVRFILTPRDFGATPVAQTQGAKEGTGNYEQVAELEWACQGNEGNYYRSRANAPVDAKRADVEQLGYELLTLTYETATHASIGAKDVSPKELVIAVPTGAAGTSITGDVTSLKDVLTAFVA